MDKNLAQDAISAALAGNWEKALKINQEIIKKKKNDIDALNRLSRSHAELGNLEKAKKISQKVLKIDPFNAIAAKSLEKLKILKKGETYKSGPSSAQVFLEEPGKTKIISLLHTGGSEVLAKLDSGDEVTLNTRPHRIAIATKDSKYIGRLPDDLSARLRKLIKYGNAYRVFIKSICKNEVKVLIRESKRSEKLADFPSFSTEKIDYISFTPPELVHKKTNLSPQDFSDSEEE